MRKQRGRWVGVTRAFSLSLTHANMAAAAFRAAVLPQRGGQRHLISAPVAPLHYSACVSGRADTTTTAGTVPSYRTGVVMAHGLMGSATNFFTILNVMSKRLEDVGFVAIDSRNHGKSPHHAVQSSLANAMDLFYFVAQMVRQQQEHHSVSPSELSYVLVGHSMGGSSLLTASVVAADQEIQRIFFDAAHDAESASDAHRRIDDAHEFVRSMYHQVVKGQVIVDVCPVSRPKAFAQIARDLDSLLDLPLTPQMTSKKAQDVLTPRIPDAMMRNFLLTNLHYGDPTRGVNASWRCNLPVLRESLPQLMFPFTDAAVDIKKVATPTLFVFGEDSEYNFPEGRAAIPSFFESALTTVIKGAGHYVHYERREEFCGAVEPLLRKWLPPPQGVSS